MLCVFLRVPTNITRWSIIDHLAAAETINVDYSKDTTLFIIELATISKWAAAVVAAVAAVLECMLLGTNTCPCLEQQGDKCDETLALPRG